MKLCVDFVSIFSGFSGFDSCQFRVESKRSILVFVFVVDAKFLFIFVPTAEISSQKKFFMIAHQHECLSLGSNHKVPHDVDCKLGIVSAVG